MKKEANPGEKFLDKMNSEQNWKVVLISQFPSEQNEVKRVK